VNREQKTEKITSLAERLENAKAIIFTEYRGLKVSETDELRSQLRENNASFKVINNRLMKRALKNAGLESLYAHFTGPTAIASSDEDPISPAKIITKFAKNHKNLIVKGGYMDGSELSINDVNSLSAMPSREELLSKALSSMSAPATNMAAVLAAIPRKLVYALNAIKETKE